MDYISLSINTSLYSHMHMNQRAGLSVLKCHKMADEFENFSEYLQL